MPQETTPPPPRTPKGTFKAGSSGNPLGRPKGWETIIRDQIAEGKDDVIKAVFKAAKAGDMQAAKLILDRLLPPLRSVSQAVNLELPSAATPLEIAQSIITSTAAGIVPPDIAAQLITALGTVCRIEDTEELRARITALEKATLSEITTKSKP